MLSKEDRTGSYKLPRHGAHTTLMPLPPFAQANSGEEGCSVLFSTARPCVFCRPLQFWGNVINFTSSCAAVGIDPYACGFIFAATVKILAQMESIRNALCVSAENTSGLAPLSAFAATVKFLAQMESIRNALCVSAENTSGLAPLGEAKETKLLNSILKHNRFIAVKALYTPARWTEPRSQSCLNLLQTQAEAVEQPWSRGSGQSLTSAALLVGRKAPSHPGSWGTVTTGPQKSVVNAHRIVI